MSGSERVFAVRLSRVFNVCVILCWLAIGTVALLGLAGYVPFNPRWSAVMVAGAAAVIIGLQIRQLAR